MMNYIHNMLTVYGALRFDNKGVTAIEYGLIAGLIAVAIIAVLTTVGGDLSALFKTIGLRLQAVNTAAAGAV